MKLPFSIKYRPQIESGEYEVITRNEEEDVSIFFYNNEFVVFINGNYDWHYDENGKWQEGKDSDYDLFIVIPEPKLTEFEESLRQVIVSALSGETPNGSGGTMKWAVYLGDDDIQKLAPKVMELAKKEICKKCTVGLDQYWKGRDDARKEAEKSCTFHYPTYEPPCHHGGICTNPFKDCINCPRTGGDIGTFTTSGTCKKD